MLWTVLFGGLFVGAIIGLFYIVFRTHKFSFIQEIAQKHKIAAWLVSLFPLAAVGLFGFINIYAVIIVLLHLMVIWFICDITGFIAKKISKKTTKKYYAGIVAIVITVIYMGYGWFSAHHVFETDYKIKTDKDLGQENLKVVTIADSHIGITLDGEKFSKEMEKISRLNPDVVVIAGDYADDDTLKKDMVKCCEALGKINTKYGVYFAYGNHDKGYFKYRDFTDEDLRAELIKNNVKILEDENILVDDKFYIIGRQDKQVTDRADMDKLTQELDKEKYKILIDHEPNDYDNEAGYVDLVLSGHTHGGHIFPAGPVGMLLKANDRNYGTENRKGTDFIVTSGISGWAIPFKTGTISEFVVTDISR